MQSKDFDDSTLAGLCIQEHRVSLSLGGGSFQEPMKAGESQQIEEPSVAAQSSDLGDDNELGLSLSLRTFAGPHADTSEEKGKGSKSWQPLDDKLQTGGFSTVTSRSINPATRKTRVSVRARCQGATVSLSENETFTCISLVKLRSSSWIRANSLSQRVLIDE